MIELVDYLERRPIHLFVLLSLSLTLYLLNARKEKSAPIRAFSYYTVTCLIINFITDYYSGQRWNNILFNNLWVLLSTLLAAKFFYEIFLDKTRKHFVLYTGIIYSIVFVVDLITVNPSLHLLHDHKFVSWSLPLRSVVLISLCGVFYVELLKELYIEHLERSSIFWIVCCLMIYYASCLFPTFIYSNEYTWESKQLYRFICELPVYFEIASMVGISLALIYEAYWLKKTKQNII